MKQLDLFKNEEDIFLQEAEEFISEMELQIEKLEEQERFFKENQAFEWDKEFPQLCDNKGNFQGFDLIIGNPPYIRQEKLVKYKSYFSKQYKVYSGTADILTYFIEQAHNLLNKNGYFSFIVSSKFTRAEYGRELRKFLINNCTINNIIDFAGYKVFDEATVDTLIMDLNKNKTEQKTINYCKIEKDIKKEKIFSYAQRNKILIPIENINEHSFIFVNEEYMKIRKKIEKKGVLLKNWDVKINFGIKTGLSKAFIIDKKIRDELIKLDKNNKKILKPVLRGRDIKKYSINYSDLYLINSHNGIKSKKIKSINVEKDYPFVYKFLLQNKEEIQKRQDQGKHWTNLRNCAYLNDFKKPKIVYQEIAETGNFCWDENNFYVNQSCYIMTGANKYILAILNSKLTTWYFKNVSVVLGKKALRWIKQYVEQIPIPQISTKEQEPFIKLVNKIIKQKKEDPKVNTIKLETQINKLVYKLYALKNNEIEIIENETT